MTLGQWPAMKLDQARDAWREARTAAAQGRDPADERKAQRDTSKREPDTFGRIADQFIKRHVDKKRPKTAVAYRHAIDEVFRPRWEHRLVKDLRKRDVVEILDELSDARKPIAANRSYAAIRKFFSWCLERDIIDASPVAGLGTPNTERKRQRTLSDDEIRLLWPIFEELGYPLGPWLQILLLTGQRREEAATMRWRDLDLEGRLWRIPTTKSDHPHLVPLSPMAAGILEGLPRFKGQYVFTTTGGERPISGFSAAKRRIDKLVAATEVGNSMEPWVVHDLRRTTRTGLSRLRVAPHVAELILGHSLRGIQAVYDIYDYLDERRHALELWAQHVEIIMTPDAGTKVVPMRPTAG